MVDRIEKSVELRAPLPKVWSALTDHTQFGEWFRVKLEGPFVVGKVSRGHITYSGYEHLVWEAKVVDIRPEEYFAFTWHPYAIDPEADYSREPSTLVEFRLEPTASGTRLTVTESGFDALPSGRRAEALRSNDQGWAIQMENIERHVSGSSKSSS